MEHIIRIKIRFLIGTVNQRGVGKVKGFGLVTRKGVGKGVGRTSGVGKRVETKKITTETPRKYLTTDEHR